MISPFSRLASTQGVSSIGRATVSKTVGYGFDSYTPCLQIIALLQDTVSQGGVLNDRVGHH